MLEKINCPGDLKSLSEKEILKLNEEIREFLISNVTKTGGHLASNLGVVELTVALHRVFDTPNDRVIFDVGHQSYVHKLLTGRRQAFDTLRQENGLSGFTKRQESEYDAFGAGHSSTAISAALGFSEADKLCGRENFTIAVVGDGAFTGGMVYEALNNCENNTRLIIILNENEMSISHNVGNLSKHISRIRSTKGYLSFKKNLSVFLLSIPVVGKPIQRFMSYLKLKLKGMVYNLNMFENMGLKYLGPIDGNDYYSVETLLREAKRKKGNILLHIKTVKGFGFDEAVQHPEKYHGIGPVCRVKETNGTFSSHAGEFLCELARENEKICAITAAMACGTGIDCFEKEFPERCFDVGIAEAHAVTFMAGLSAGGMKPVFAVYSTFLQRAYDNIIHDIALQKLSGLILVDRAGFATEDGATHHGLYDAAFLSQINGTTLYEPFSFETFRNMMNYSIENDGLFVIRYPKGAEDTELCNIFEKDVEDSFGILKYGFSENTKNVIICYGRIAKEAVYAADRLNKNGNSTAVIVLQTLCPLDNQLDKIGKLVCDAKKIALLEEGIKNGGIAMLLREKLIDTEYATSENTKVFAIDGEIPEQGELRSLYKKCGISETDLITYFDGEEI